MQRLCLLHLRTNVKSVMSVAALRFQTQSGAALKARYPNDRFEIQQRPRPAAVAGVPPPPPPAQPEWRVRCLDCPGKLYTPGPGESLNNFEARNEHDPNLVQTLGR